MTSELAPVGLQFDPETLHEIVADPDQLAAWLDEQLHAKVPPDPEAECSYRTAIGSAARSLRRLDVAEEQLGRALALAERHGTPAQIVLARVRYAHVLQWRGQFAAADELFNRCVADAPLAGGRAHFIYQHAGQCAYDAGDWATARDRFAAALWLRRRRGDQELIASSQLAVNAAEACHTVATVAVELHRLVPGGHMVAQPVAGSVLAPLRPNGGALIELRTLLVRPEPVPLRVARAIYRYSARFERALPALADGGWLTVDGETVTSTERCRALLTELLAALDTVVSKLWSGTAELLPDLLATAEDLVAAGKGGSEGDAFDAFAEAGHPVHGSTAGRLFTALSALRYHRADAHAAAWAAEGLTVDGVRALAEDDPLRRRIETATDRVAARPYRVLTRERSAGLLCALRSLAG